MKSLVRFLFVGLFCEFAFGSLIHLDFELYLAESRANSSTVLNEFRFVATSLLILLDVALCLIICHLHHGFSHFNS